MNEVIDVTIREALEVKWDFENSNLVNPHKYNTIYHYTSPKGLKGIIESHSLWFTHADYLNDTTEGFYFIDLYKKVVQDYIETNGSSELTIFLESIEDFHSYGFVFENDTMDGGEGEVYICSFSADNDSLPMWNYYVKDNKKQGYNIGFYVVNLNEIKNYTKEIVEVIYDEKEQTQMIMKVIDKLKKYYDKTKEMHLKQLFISEMCKLKYMFKNPCFEYEHEVRILVTLPNKMKDRIKFRPGVNGEFIPYIEVSLMDDEFNLMDSPMITVAPLMDFERAKNSLKMLVEENGIHDYEIIKSKCPIRY